MNTRVMVVCLGVWWMVFAGMQEVTATTLTYKNVPSLVTEATWILRAKVLKLHTVPSPKRWTSYTYVTLRVSDVVKGGTLPADKTFVLRFEGDWTSPYSVPIPGMTPLYEGHDYILFIGNPQAGMCPIVGWAQGVFEVTVNAQGKEFLIDGGAGRAVLDLHENTVLLDQPISSAPLLLTTADGSAIESLAPDAGQQASVVAMHPTDFLSAIAGVVAEQLEHYTPAPELPIYEEDLPLPPDEERAPVTSPPAPTTTETPHPIQATPRPQQTPAPASEEDAP